MKVKREREREREREIEREREREREFMGLINVLQPVRHHSNKRKRMIKVKERTRKKLRRHNNS